LLTKANNNDSLLSVLSKTDDKDKATLYNNLSKQIIYKNRKVRDGKLLYKWKVDENINSKRIIMKKEEGLKKRG